MAVKKSETGTLVVPILDVKHKPGVAEEIQLSAAIRKRVSPSKLAEFWANILEGSGYTVQEKMIAAKEIANRGWGMPSAHVVVNSTDTNASLDLDELTSAQFNLLAEMVDAHKRGKSEKVHPLGGFDTAKYLNAIYEDDSEEGG